MQMFKKFDLSIFFDISTTKSVDKNKLDFVADGEYDFIGRTSVNWGIQGKLHKLSFEPNPKDSFSLVQVGETVALWREKEWYASQNLFLLNPKIDEVKENKLYFQGVINKEMSRYGKEYSSYPTMKSLETTKILLPVVESPEPGHEYTVNDIDWSYMKQRIAELEKQRIAELDAYLAVSGLNNYELTDEDKKILSSSTIQIFKMFKVGELFDIHPTATYKMKNNELFASDGTTPVLSNSSMNNGIGGYCGLAPTEQGEMITFSDTTTGADTMFYQSCPFIGYPHVQGMYPYQPNKWDEKCCLYVISCIRKSAGNDWNYAVKFNRALVKELFVELPVVKFSDSEHEYTVKDIDFEYMKKYISATEKLAIADVVRYKNASIETTKKIVDAK